MEHGKQNTWVCSWQIIGSQDTVNSTIFNSQQDTKYLIKIHLLFTISAYFPPYAVSYVGFLRVISFVEMT